MIEYIVGAIVGALVTFVIFSKYIKLDAEHHELIRELMDIYEKLLEARNDPN